MRASRRFLASTLALFGLLALAHHALPSVVAWKVRRELAARGFDEARFRVVEIGFDRLELADVELARGLWLGTVEIDAGVTLLWRDPEVVSIRGARIEQDALARLRSAAPDLTARTLRLEDSVLVVGDTSIAINGTIDLGAPTPSAQLVATTSTWKVGDALLRDVVVRVDGAEACASALLGPAKLAACAGLTSWRLQALAFVWRARDSAWDASGNARIDWSEHISIRGDVGAKAARSSHGGVALADITIGAEFEGTLDRFEARGTLRAAHATKNEVTLVDAKAPFILRGVHMARQWRIDSGMLETSARELVGHRRGERVRALEVGLRIDPFEVAGDAAGLDGLHVAWNAKRVEVGRAILIGAAGTVDRTSNTWRANELVVDRVRLRSVTGAIGSDEIVRWRAADLRFEDASLSGLTGTLRGREVEWSADAGRWRDLTVERPTGRISTRGLEVSAPRARWRDLELGAPHAIRDSHGDVRWEVREVSRGPDSMRELVGSSSGGRHELAWREVRIGRVELAAGTLSLVSEHDRWLLARGSVAAYGGQIVLAHPVAPSEPIELHVRGLRLESLLAAISRRTSGRGVLDGTITVRDGELERADLRTRGAGTFQIGNREWVDRAVKSIAAGHVAVPERIGGALADFEFTRLGLAVTPASNGPAVRVQIDGTGRRVRQELHLVINVRGMREAARLLARAWEAS